jgi:hypothetical protein
MPRWQPDPVAWRRLSQPDAEALHGRPRKRTPPALISRIDQLLEFDDDQIVADHLNAAGIHNWCYSAFIKGQIAMSAKVAAWPVIVNAVTPMVTRHPESWPHATT